MPMIFLLFAVAFGLILGLWMPFCFRSSKRMGAWRVPYLEFFDRNGRREKQIQWALGLWGFSVPLWIVSQKYIGGIVAMMMLGMSTLATLIAVVWLRLASNREAGARTTQ